MRLVIALALLALGIVPAPAGADGCGTPEGECPTNQGFYRLVLPASAAAPVPALAYLHGWGGSSAGVVKNQAMLEKLSARGYALIAPEGKTISPERPQKNWTVRDGSSYDRDDMAFLAEVLDDAARHGVDRGRILIAGFSRGGSMVWDIACHAPEMARAYAPIAGAFWLPMPEGCDQGADLFHTHGWRDKVIPLEGRSVGGGTRTQGDTFASLKILRAANHCAVEQPDLKRIDEDGSLTRVWTECPGGEIELWIHQGHHGTPKGWLTRVLDWFEARLAEG